MDMGVDASMEWKISRAHRRCLCYASETLYLIFSDMIATSNHIIISCEMKGTIWGSQTVKSGELAHRPTDWLIVFRARALLPGNMVWTPDHKQSNTQPIPFVHYKMRFKGHVLYHNIPSIKIQRSYNKNHCTSERQAGTIGQLALNVKYQQMWTSSNLRNSLNMIMINPILKEWNSAVH